AGERTFALARCGSRSNGESRSLSRIRRGAIRFEHHFFANKVSDIAKKRSDTAQIICAVSKWYLPLLATNPPALHARAKISVNQHCARPQPQFWDEDWCQR